MHSSYLFYCKQTELKHFFTQRHIFQRILKILWAGPTANETPQSSYPLWKSQEALTDDENIVNTNALSILCGPLQSLSWSHHLSIIQVGPTYIHYQAGGGARYNFGYLADPSFSSWLHHISYHCVGFTIILMDPASGSVGPKPSFLLVTVACGPSPHRRLQIK